MQHEHGSVRYDDQKEQHFEADYWAAAISQWAGKTCLICARENTRIFKSGGLLHKS
jgi:hypothetical protein